MIHNFAHKGLKRLYERGDRSKIRPDLLRKVEDVLARLDVASEPEALQLPGYNLHRLTGDLEGFWSITISRNHRIIFRMAHGDVHDVNLVDYH